ncbi:YdcF family protein [uncultured Methylophaga sp.]|uniref:YdcF family protein n=1 Tax=uncultured Methylophaga sp. TaxID=285271 RepID=UPI00261D7110|nr:YdcF family protein [uncultured Methylophaga sp.]
MDNLFFVASKLLWGLLSPVNLLVWILLLATLLLWLNYVKAARRLLTLLTLLAITLMAYPVSDWLLYPLETRFEKPASLPDNIDGIIVLGGAENLKLSVGWQAAQMGEGGERILASAKLSRDYPDLPIIYTGGSNLVQMPALDEDGQVSQILLSQAGIKTSQVLMENRARNTHENFVMIKPMLPDPEGRYLLVTSAFHMPRSVGVARKQGIDVIPYPVDYRSARPEQRYWDFDLFSHLSVLEVAWHEWIGLSAYFATGKSAAWFPAPRSQARDE